MKIRWEIDELLDFRDKLSEITELEKHLKKATQELAKVLQDMLFQYTPVKTGNLCASWGGKGNMAYTVKQTAQGFMVTLTNGAVNERGEKYGAWVNDGHRSFNQHGGPYGFVKGQFFVEKSVIASEDKADDVLYYELEKWFRWCCGG